MSDRSNRPAMFTRASLAGSSFRRVLFGLVISIVVYIVAPRGGKGLGVLVMMSIYSVADPVINMSRPHWWRNALKSFGSFLLLVLATAFVSDDLGEASMLFMLPVFVFPIALGITGLIRFLRDQLAPP